MQQLQVLIDSMYRAQKNFFSEREFYRNIFFKMYTQIAALIFQLEKNTEVRRILLANNKFFKIYQRIEAQRQIIFSPQCFLLEKNHFDSFAKDIFLFLKQITDILEANLSIETEREYNAIENGARKKDRKYPIFRCRTG